VRIGAILTQAEGRAAENYFRRASAGDNPETNRPSALNYPLDVLGTPLLERSVAKLLRAGVESTTVLKDASSSGNLIPAQRGKGSALLPEWEKTVAGAINDGIDYLFLVRVGAYTDLDYSDLLEFHLHTRAPFTRAYEPAGAVDVAVVSLKSLRDSSGNCRKALFSLVPQQRRFDFSGYINPLRNLRDLYQLMQDGLYGRCDLRPAGTEIRENVWVGQRAKIDATAAVSGPAFIGDASEISASCAIAGGCSIERNCKIDYGTLIQESCILQNTYVGVALDVRRAVAGGQKMYPLNRNVEIKIADRRLVRSNLKNSSLFAELGSWLSGGAQQAD
jgi:NDP-sugar pyrophosphorylase family protein